MALAIDKRDRETAKTGHLYLFQISIDGKYTETGFGKSESSGACGEELANELRKLIREWPDGIARNGAA